MRRAHELFWQTHPALLLALSFLLGTSSYLYKISCFFPLIWLIYLGWINFSFLFRGVCLLLLSWGYSFALYQNAPRASVATYVKGVFSVSSLQPHQSPFHRGLLYKGTLYLPDAISCSMCLSGGNRPLADQDYFVEGLLVERSPFSYTLKMKKCRPLGPEKTTWRSAEMRYQSKEALRLFLQKNLSKKSASLLGSLLTGDVEDRLLRYEFSKTGLQHLLSISGFHFALLTTFFSFSFGLFFSQPLKTYLLLLTLFGYFLFVGPSPAIFRSFCAVSLYLIGKILGRHPIALNLLGCAMLLELIFDPTVSAHIGFQLSFLSCAALLLLFSPLQALIEKWLPRRGQSELAQMSFLSPFGYLISTFFKKSLSVTFAVNLALLPLLFYHFHKWPLLSLFYNLFFPLSVALAIYLLIPSLLAYLLFAPLGKFLLKLTDFWTNQLLDLVSHPPLFLDRTCALANLPDWACAGYLFLLFFLAIANHTIRDKLLIANGHQKNNVLTLQAIRK